MNEKIAGKTEEKVLVALSGGPESFVVAWLLKKQGKQLRGIYFDLTGSQTTREGIAKMERKLGIAIQIVDCAEEFKLRLAAEIEESGTSAKKLNPKWLFQTQILFPKLFELQSQYQFQQIATGHRVLLQQDPLQKKTGVFLYSDRALDESHFLLGLKNEELQILELPLGSIPVAMINRIASELELERGQDEFDFDFKSAYQKIYESIYDDQPKMGDVILTDGTRLGTCSDLSVLKLGEPYSGETLDTSQKFIVLDIDSVNRKTEVGPTGSRVLQELQFDQAQWFGAPDLNLNAIDCGMIWFPDQDPIPVSLIQYEGGRLKTILEEPLRDDQANIFNGEVVLWISDQEVLGGARLFKAIRAV